MAWLVGIPLRALTARGRRRPMPICAHTRDALAQRRTKSLTVLAVQRYMGKPTAGGDRPRSVGRPVGEMDRGGERRLLKTMNLPRGVRK